MQPREQRACRLRARNAARQSKIFSIACLCVAWFLIVPALHATAEPAQELAKSLSRAPGRQPDTRRDANDTGRSSSEPTITEGSGITVWAGGFEGQLIAGLDGALYSPYR